MRLFIAAVLPAELVDALAETTALLRECVRGRFVAPEMLHVTLAFLGDVDAARIAQVLDALENGCAGHPAFRTRLAGLGSFGKPRNCTLWQGFSHPEDAPDPWAPLARDVRDALRSKGFSYDEKPFEPHVTLMRSANVEKTPVLPMPVVAGGTVSNIALFKSDISGPYPVYEQIGSVGLTNL